MKALASLHPGGPQSLTLIDLPDPVPSSGELLVKVAACGVNYPDVLIIEDKYQFKPARPFAPGSEIAGIVLEEGPGVEGWKVGDRLVGTMLGSGGMAEKALVKAHAAFRLPANCDFIHGAGLLLTYTTAIHALKDRGHLRAGQTVLVLGAAGGVGLASIEIARAMGARVVAAVSSNEKLEAAKSKGADATIVYPRGPLDAEAMRSLALQLKKLVGPAGADVILDPVGGDYAEPALRSIAWAGRYLVVGFPAGIPRIALNLVLLKGCEIVGVFQGEFGERNPAANATNVAQLFAWWQQGLISPRVSAVYPLDRGADAIAQLASRSALGKLVVAVSDI
jgi:NADPH:quinone reductase